MIAKVDMSTLPKRMQGLPIDDRGYPVPWFVDWIDGKPEFRAMDPKKFVRAVKERLCWVCGEKLGVNLCFVAGPMCGVNRTSSEPPSHYECAKWSVINCPFLNNPRMVRREDELINTADARDKGAGFMIARNPGVTMLWRTREYEVFPALNSGYLIQMGRPESVEWYREGRTATRDEVLESVESGLPNLTAIAMTQPGGVEALARAVVLFQRHYPSEVSA